jgi:Flp pilus assembly pilin Flp
MKNLNSFLKTMKRHHTEERGESTVEWAGLMAAIAILLIAVIGYMNIAGGGTVGQAVSDVMSQMVFSFEGGGSAGAPNIGAPSAPIPNLPTIAIPLAPLPDIALPSVGVSQLVSEEIVGEEGGGFWE